MKARIHFLNGNDQSIQDHYRQKGYRDDIILEIDELFYEIYFYIEGNITYEVKNGFFSFPGLIILEDITNERIYSAVNQLLDLNYFNYFVGQKIFPLNTRFQDLWYSNNLKGWDRYNKCIHELR